MWWSKWEHVVDRKGNKLMAASAYDAFKKALDRVDGIKQIDGLAIPLGIGPEGMMKWRKNQTQSPLEGGLAMIAKLLRVNHMVLLQLQYM